MKRNALLLSVLILLSLSAAGCSYNTLQAKHQNLKAKWSNIETQLQRRNDLLGNLIETAKLSGVQEQEVFGTIAKARSQLLNATSAQPQGDAGDKSPEQKQAAIATATNLAGTVGRFRSPQAQYPRLESHGKFLHSQAQVPRT